MKSTLGTLSLQKFKTEKAIVFARLLHLKHSKTLRHKVYIIKIGSRRFLPWKLKIRPANTNVGVGLGMNERFGSFRKRSTIFATQGHRRREADPFPRGSMGARITTPKFGCLGLSAFSMSSDSCRSWL